MAVGRFEVRVEGRAAHSGLAPDQGASAIWELALLITRIYELDEPPEALVNVGSISGGTHPNVVASDAVATVELRAQTNDGADRLEARLRALRSSHPDLELTVAGSWHRPAMEKTARNDRLSRIARDAATTLGFEISEASVGGASDGNLTSRLTATLDGLGAVGYGAHSSEERVVIAHMAPRAALAAAVLLSA
jgi:glutamate carboxypeptidase